MAPAVAAVSIFKLIPQAPRSISAILPLGLAKYGSAGLPGLMEFAGQPRPTYTTSLVTDVSTGAKLSLAVLVYDPEMLAGELTTSGITEETF